MNQMVLFAVMVLVGMAGAVFNYGLTKIGLKKKIEVLKLKKPVIQGVIVAFALWMVFRASGDQSLGITLTAVTAIVGEKSWAIARNGGILPMPWDNKAVAGPPKTP